MKRGADVNAKGLDGKTCLYVAAENKQLHIVEFILTIPGLRVDMKRINGRTALYIASINGHIDIVKHLVEKGGKHMNIDTTEEEGMTSLLGACFVGKINVVRYLISKGADLMAKTNDGTNCLILAAGMENFRKDKPFAQQGRCGNASAVTELLSLEQVIKSSLQMYGYLHISL